MCLSFLEYWYFEILFILAKIDGHFLIVALKVSSFNSSNILLSQLLKIKNLFIANQIL